MSNDQELYVFEKIYQALECLATGVGRIQERLEEAFRYLVAAQPAELSDVELRHMLAGIKDDLTFDEPTGAEGRLKATLRHLSDEDASKIASHILELHNRLWEQTMGPTS
ncbi:MAG: hypothetical protein ABSG53_19045 [Thermoguttaceae bacterium]|jgi:hypothetical protein